MAGAGIRALAGAKPMSNKALSAHVTARGWAAEAHVKAAMAAGVKAKTSAMGGGSGGETAAKLVPATAHPKLAAAPADAKTAELRAAKNAGASKPAG